MSIKSNLKLRLFFTLNLLFFLSSNPLVCHQNVGSMESMMERIVGSQKYGLKQANYFKHLSRLFFNFLEKAAMFVLK